MRRPQVRRARLFIFWPMTECRCRLVRNGVNIAFSRRACRCGRNRTARIYIYFAALIDATIMVVPSVVPLITTFCPASLSNCALSPFRV